MNPERSRFVAGAPYEREREEQQSEIETEITKIGGFLDQLFSELPAHLTQERAKWFIDGVATLFFRRQRRSLWVEKTEYHRAQPEQGALLRAFRIVLVPPTGEAKPEWIINEVVEHQGAKYEAYILDYDQRRVDGDRYPVEQNVKDPTTDDLSESECLMAECWELFKEGREDAILLYSTPIPRGRHRTAE